MRVHKELLTTPIFIGGRDSLGDLHYRATAFLVGVPTPMNRRFGALALVTARHNIRRAQETYGNVWIRCNTRDGKARDVEITATWEFPDDPAVDVAAVPFDPDLAGTQEALPIPVYWFVTDELVEKRDMGPGDELTIMGLFSAHVGSERNLPVARSGSIASMPLEPLVDKETGCTFSAYLAEVRSIGGLSGSPVFVVLNPATRLHATDGDTSSQHYYLLGLVRGHWHRRADVADYADSEFEQLNMGIAMVTPATELKPLLEREVFVEAGEEMDRRRQQAKADEHTQVEDYASDDRAEFEKFEDLTKKLVNTPKPDPDQKRDK